MTVEQLMRLLSEYPPHWHVEIGTLPAVEVSTRQTWDIPTPVVVIST